MYVCPVLAGFWCALIVVTRFRDARIFATEFRRGCVLLIAVAVGPLAIYLSSPKTSVPFWVSLLVFVVAFFYLPKQKLPSKSDPRHKPSSRRSAHSPRMKAPATALRDSRSEDLPAKCNNSVLASLLGWVKVLRLRSIISDEAMRDASRRNRAITALGGTGSRRALPLLTDLVLYGERPYERTLAAKALGELGIRDEGCTQALVAMFRAKNRQHYELEAALSALTNLGWLPDTQAESERVERIRQIQVDNLRKAEREAEEEIQVHTWITLWDSHSLNANWWITKRVLIKELDSGSRIAAVNAARILVRLGHDEVIPNLLLAMRSRSASLDRNLPLPVAFRTSPLPPDHSMDELLGGKGIADVLLNCGQEDLEKAAREWATQSGYSINRQSISEQVRWGST